MGLFRVHRVHFLLVLLILLVRSTTAGGHGLALSAGGTGDPSADLVLQGASEVQGLVAAFDWDGTKLTGLDLPAGQVLAEADLVIRRIESSYMVLGVVMDNDGLGGEIIPAGTHVLARAMFRCAVPQGQDSVVDLVFKDGIYGTSELGPRLVNLLTVGGQTISRQEGLVLVDGRITCSGAPPAPGSLRIRDAVASAITGCAAADVVLDTASPVEGFIVAIAHDPAAISLSEISIAGTVTATSGADFIEPRILPDGGILEVIMDLEPPFSGNTIPAGNGQVIARFVYCCKQEPPAGGPDRVTALRFVDGVLGDPPLENTLVVGGRQVKPADLIPGTFTCRAKDIENPLEFRCGSEVDPVSGGLLPIIAWPGSTARVSFFYRSMPKGTPGDTGEDQIQGLSMSICYDPRFVRCREGSFDIGGTITEAMAAEFVNHNCENTLEDGDAGELVVGILVDALPPFDGHTLPPTRDLLKIGSVEFAVAPEAPCDRCNDVTFCDGADGRGSVPIRNLISVNNQSVRPAFYDCAICVAATPVFQRGDCNSSRGGALAVDIADPVAMVNAIFLPKDSQYRPSCLDACDANDDGRVDLADAVFVLRYLFRDGKPPPAPGPNAPGPDPTEDRLDCAAESVCP